VFATPWFNAGFSPPAAKGKSHEANVPALRRPAQADARLSRAHAHSRRPGGDPRAPREGAHAARRLTVGTGSPGRPGRAQRLRREQRLGTAAVAAALKGGKAIRTTRFQLYRLPSPLDYPRLALVVPKRLAPRAVTRNRIRRLVREAFRMQQQRLGALDCVVRLVKAPGETPVTLAEIEALLARAAA
jgi:ribonuclease P protein component